MLSTAVLFGCDGTLDGPDDDEDPVERPPCETALSITPASSSVGPRGILVLRAEGGTGAYRFTIDDDGSTGTRIGERTGVLVGGDLAGEVAVRLADRACTGEASATVTVSDRLVLEPGTVEVAPGSEVRFVARGGVGPFTYELGRDESGASIDGAGVYRAGTLEGDDVVRVIDDATGARADASVTVSTSAGLRPLVGRVILPVGSTHQLAVTGGSGYFDVTGTGDAIELVDGELRAMSAGRVDVELVDRYTAARARITIDAVASQEAPIARIGDRLDTDTVLSGDFDGDGDVDVLLAMQGASVSRHRQGAVYLWRNEGGTLGPAPTRVITGVRRDDQLGSSVALGDLDADGVIDLVIGVWQADLSGANVGVVRVYRGIAGELFASEPMLSFAGVTGGDRFGASLAVCDFDGDGDQDLAIGAADAENRMLVPRHDQQGAVYLYPSYEGRFLGVAGQVLYGALPDGAGSARIFRDMRFGTTLAAGDVDGDGLCDLAVHAAKADPDVGSDGAVLVFRGRAAAADGMQGGLEPLPSLVVSATETSDRGSRFGAFLAVGDLDGDGLAELAASQHGHDLASGGSDAGALRVFRGRALSGPATSVTSVASADWTHEGPDNARNYGHQVRIADANVDGRLDLLVCDSRAALEGSALSRPGVLRVFHGRAGALPSSTPDVEHEGTSNEERFGQAFAVLGDITGDGNGDLFALAVHGDRDGLDVGTPYVIAGAGDYRALELPGAATGRRFGQSLAVVDDVSGDGRADLIVGAPRQSDMRNGEGVSRGFDHGAAYLYLGGTDGFSRAPDVTFFDHPGHSEADNFGEWVGTAGDFDGDGAGDLAIVARTEDQPATYDEARYALDGTCPTSTRFDTGAVFVYRGGATGPNATSPAFVYYGPGANRGTNVVVGGFDADGDGRGDLAIGGTNWLDPGNADERRGGFAIVRGRAPDAMGRTLVICAADWIEYGDASNDELGASIAALGDLDGDGCDDLAIGAPLADRMGANDEGLVRVHFGFGGASCPETTPSIGTLRPFDRTSHTGRALASGVDLDGDGLAELVIGAPRYTTGGGQIGRVYVVSGAYLASLRGATDVQPLLGGGDGDGWVIDGIDPGELAGSGVALVPGIGEGARGAVVVGGLHAAIAGAPDTGGARFVSWTASGPAPSAFALLSGETTSDRSELGAPIAWGRLGTRTVIVAGASWGHAHSVDSGSVYAFAY